MNTGSNRLSSNSTSKEKNLPITQKLELSIRAKLAWNRWVRAQFIYQTVAQILWTNRIIEFKVSNQGEDCICKSVDKIHYFSTIFALHLTIVFCNRGADTAWFNDSYSFTTTSYNIEGLDKKLIPAANYKNRYAITPQLICIFHMEFRFTDNSCESTSKCTPSKIEIGQSNNYRLLFGNICNAHNFCFDEF